jgi:predicted RecB family nuclease
MPLTASQLYNQLICPHRVSMDAFGDATKKEQPNPFVQMLWERGSLFEKDTIARLGESFTDLSGLSGDEKESATRAAMARGDALIYDGRFSEDNLLGEPDLLRRESVDGTGRARYVSIDIKSGAGDIGGDDDADDPGKPKKHYAVQLALYTDILIRIGHDAGRYAYVLDVHGDQVRYDFDAPLGARNTQSLWELYLNARRQVSDALEREGVTRAACSSMCKLCVWRSACLADLKSTRDLTLLPELGRARRDALMTEFPALEDLAGANVESFIDKKKTTFSGVGADMLRRFQARAKLATDPKPKAYLKKRIELASSSTELFFDIETDPMRDLCYLHGIVVRTNRDAASERFIGVFADDVSAVSEQKAFAQAMAIFRQYPQAVVYIYSKYERTVYRQLAAKYPEVATAEEIDALFATGRCIDLYGDIVRPYAEFPTLDFGIKSVAKNLGFEWRDLDPSGASSIQWFQRWVETQDPKDKQRILDYNEDDCRAMRVIVDALPLLAVREN